MIKRIIQWFKDLDELMLWKEYEFKKYIGVFIYLDGRKKQAIMNGPAHNFYDELIPQIGFFDENELPAEQKFRTFVAVLRTTLNGVTHIVYEERRSLDDATSKIPPKIDIDSRSVDGIDKEQE